MVSKMESPPLIGPRVSFSADLSDGGDLICIGPCKELEKGSTKVADFEFLSDNVSPQMILTADELFSEGKFLPFRQVKHSEKLKNLNFKTNKEKEEEEEENRKVEVTTTTMMKNNIDEEHNRVSWFIDEDPSPRPPKCTVLWKELLRLKKQRHSSSSSVRTVSYLSPSSSTSSSSSLEEREKEGKRGKKGLERTRSATMRIRPMIHVPICTPSYKSSVPLPPLFPLTLKKNRVERPELKTFESTH